MTVDETTVAVLLKGDENPTQFLKQLLPTRDSVLGIQGVQRMAAVLKTAGRAHSRIEAEQISL